MTGVVGFGIRGKRYHELIQQDLAGGHGHLRGKPAPNKMEKDIRSAAGNDPCVRLFLEWVENLELQKYLKAAALLVFPYRHILNSGGALLGLSFDRPVRVSRLGAMATLQKAVGTNWIRTYEGELNAAILGEAIDCALDESRGQHAPLDSMNWSPLAHQTIPAYRTIAGNTN